MGCAIPVLHARGTLGRGGFKGAPKFGGKFRESAGRSARPAIAIDKARVAPARHQNSVAPSSSTSFCSTSSMPTQATLSYFQSSHSTCTAVSTFRITAGYCWPFHVANTLMPTLRCCAMGCRENGSSRGQSLLRWRAGAPRPPDARQRASDNLSSRAGARASGQNGYGARAQQELPIDLRHTMHGCQRTGCHP